MNQTHLRSDRISPKVLFVDDLNTYRDLLGNIDSYQIKEMIATTYNKNWSLPATVDSRHFGKSCNLTIDPDFLPWPVIQYRHLHVISVDVSIIDRQIVITFNMGTKVTCQI